MTQKTIYNILENKFAHKPTKDQSHLFSKFSEFMADKSANKLFLLKGYAGTGKTSFVQSIVSTLPYMRIRSVLLAPTGRAAKVLSAYAGKQALTIHKKIFFSSLDKNGVYKLKLKENLHSNTLFIVDEASMIPDSMQFTNNELLSDLIEFVYSGQNCQLVLIGDTAQLPPVHLDLSPALIVEHLKKMYPFDIYQYELSEVVRQATESGILYNATQIRDRIVAENMSKPIFTSTGFDDTLCIEGSELQETLADAYATFGEENVVLITWSNKRANSYNKEIRSRILFKENKIESGDLLMVVKNNYFWIDNGSRSGFIANGDILEVQKLIIYKEIYGFEFAEVEVKMIDYPDEPSFNTILLLNTLNAESPALSFEDNNRLFQEVMKDYPEIRSRKSRIEAVKNNRYFNALQVKFAHALTCHKTQGGQWDVVFVEQPWEPEKTLTKEIARWLYTAITRASNTLYFINFKSDYFKT
jgi:exodeoxyribonuclease-5